MSILHSWLLAGAMLGQAPENAAEKDPDAGAPKAVLESFVGDARTYVMTLRGPKQEPLEFLDRPLLHWGNPARTSEDGAVFVWLKEGRPEVIGTIFEYPYREKTVRKHAFHSLSEEPVLASFKDVEIWAPETAGVKFSAVPEGKPPADDARRRLAQMRDIARQFSVDMIDLRDAKSQLRLISQPLIRYEPEAGATKDGAIFAFAVGTDPEALLLLEARKSRETTRWEYAFARFHFVTLTAQHAGKQVWQVEADRDMPRAVFAKDDPQREKIYYSVVKP